MSIMLMSSPLNLCKLFMATVFPSIEAQLNDMGLTINVSYADIQEPLKTAEQLLVSEKLYIVFSQPLSTIDISKVFKIFKEYHLEDAFTIGSFFVDYSASAICTVESRRLLYSFFQMTQGYAQ